MYWECQFIRPSVLCETQSYFNNRWRLPRKEATPDVNHCKDRTITDSIHGYGANSKWMDGKPIFYHQVCHNEHHPPVQVLTMHTKSEEISHPMNVPMMEPHEWYSARIQNAISAAIRKNRSYAEITFHIAAKLDLADSETFPMRPFRPRSATFWIHAY